MSQASEVFSAEDPWDVLRKHFAMSGGLLDQIEQGRIVSVKLGSEPEECQELQDIKKALETVHHLWEGRHTLPKWQICLLWSVAPSIENMLQHLPKQALTLHILHAKLFTWIGDVLNDLDREHDAEYWIVHNVAMHLSGLRSFDSELVFGRINVEAFEELVQAVNALRMIWRGQMVIPRLAAWLFILVPILGWDHVGFSEETKKQLGEMKHLLYPLIDECFCEEASQQ